METRTIFRIFLGLAAASTLGFETGLPLSPAPVANPLIEQPRASARRREPMGPPIPHRRCYGFAATRPSTRTRTLLAPSSGRSLRLRCRATSP
jgi:hypothetical protein